MIRWPTLTKYCINEVSQGQVLFVKCLQTFLEFETGCLADRTSDHGISLLFAWLSDF